jgi:hypothetical protein
MVVNQFPFEVVPLVLILGALHLLLQQFRLSIQQGPIFDRQVTVFLHHFPHAALQLFIDVVQVVELLQQYHVFLVFYLQLLTQPHHRLPEG